jgi:hypothetical protein
LGFLLFGAAYIALLPFIGYIAAVALMIGAVALYEGAPRTLDRANRGDRRRGALLGDLRKSCSASTSRSARSSKGCSR